MRISCALAASASCLAFFLVPALAAPIRSVEARFSFGFGPELNPELCAKYGVLCPLNSDVKPHGNMTLFTREAADESGAVKISIDWSPIINWANKAFSHAQGVLNGSISTGSPLVSSSNGIVSNSSSRRRREPIRGSLGGTTQRRELTKLSARAATSSRRRSTFRTRKMPYGETS